METDGRNVMKTGYTRERMRRLASLLLAVVVAVTFMPFLDDGSYAATNKKPNEKVKYIEKKADGTEVELDPEIFEGDGEILNPDDATLEKLGIGVEPEPKDIIPMAEESSMPSGVDLEEELSAASTSPDSGTIVINEALSEAGEDNKEAESEKLVLAEPKEQAEAAVDIIPETESQSELNSVDTDIASETNQLVEAENNVTAQSITYSGFTVTQPNSSGILYANIRLSSDVTPNNGTIELRIDGVWYKRWTWNSKSAYIDNSNGAVNITDLSPGIHRVIFAFKTSSAATWYTTQDADAKYIKSSVYHRPSSGVGSFAFYSSYFDYLSPLFDSVAISKGYKLYLDLYQNGAYVGTYGPMNYIQNKQIGGLVPNTDYQVYIYYGKVINYGGTNYFLSGKDTGTTTFAGTFRSGIAKLPKIKSIKVKAYKVKKRRAGVYGWYTGYYFGSVKYYTYRIKVTVQFKTKKKKKKPGLNGLYINGIWKPGNKKKYTLKLGPYANYSKPKGKKFNVYLYSAHAPGGYGGYSPMYSKTKKVK